MIGDHVAKDERVKEEEKEERVKVEGGEGYKGCGLTQLNHLSKNIDLYIRMTVLREQQIKVGSKNKLHWCYIVTNPICRHFDHEQNWIKYEIHVFVSSLMLRRMG